MKKDLSVECLRGLACVLLVTYHVIGDNSEQGLRVAADSYLRYLNDSLVYLRMPLFTFLSGYVYSLRPVISNPIGFLVKKVRRLIIPMLVVGTLYIGLQHLVPGTNSTYSFITLYSFYPVAHFWFLEALLLIFVVLVPMEFSGILKRKGSFFLVLLFFSGISLSQVKTTTFFAVNGAVYLMPYFLLGVGIHRFNLDNIGSGVKSLILIVALISVLFSQLGLSGVVEIDLAGRSLVAFLLGAAGVVSLFLFRFENKFLAAIGEYSYTIYLFHVFSAAAVRIVMVRLGVTSLELHLFLGIIAGIAAPILLEKLLSKYSVARLLLFGKSAR